jgi:hypothetical protein
MANASCLGSSGCRAPGLMVAIKLRYSPLWRGLRRACPSAMQQRAAQAVARSEVGWPITRGGRTER